jgi:hypothetical protein
MSAPDGADMKTWITALIILMTLSTSGVGAGEGTTGAEDETPTEARSASVTWAIGRFERAALDLPDFEVAFAEDPGQCGGNTAIAVHSEQASRIVVCTDNGVSETVIHRTLLHEIAHIWARVTLDDATRETFMVERGLERWDEGRWHERGSEQAAEVITWALMDRELLMATLTDHTPDSLIASYETLTGSTVPGR